MTQLVPSAGRPCAQAHAFQAHVVRVSELRPQAAQHFLARALQVLLVNLALVVGDEEPTVCGLPNFEMGSRDKCADEAGWRC